MGIGNQGVQHKNLDVAALRISRIVFEPETTSTRLVREKHPLLPKYS